MKDVQDQANDAFSAIPVGPLGLIAMDNCGELGKKVNRHLLQWRQERENTRDELYTFPGYQQDTFMLEASCPRFGTGEGKGVIRQSVRGYDLYILSDIGNYSCTFPLYGVDCPMSPDDHFQDLKRIIGAVGGKARRINVITPQLYEGRQHRRQSRESLDCAIALQELERMGVENIITFDAHDPRVQNAIPLIGFESVLPSYQILKALLNSEQDLQLDSDHMMIISPDEGAMSRNIYYATMMGLDLGMFYKRRDYTTVINGRNPIVAHEYLGASVENKDILIADDIIATGESMLDLAYELKKRKANRIYLTATFAQFTAGLTSFEKAYREGVVTKVISTNLTYCPPALLDKPWYVQADMSKYIAYLIATLNHDRSVSKLLNPLQRIRNLISRYQEYPHMRGHISGS